MQKETPMIKIQIKKKITIRINRFLPLYLKFSQYKSSGSGGSSTSIPFILLNFIFSPLLTQQQHR